jgi:hypothetical protein
LHVSHPDEGLEFKKRKKNTWFLPFKNLKFGRERKIQKIIGLYMGKDGVIYRLLEDGGGQLSLV